MTARRALTICTALALCAACSSEGDAPSAEQDRDMNQAAEMLNKAPDSLSRVDDGGLDQELAGNRAGGTD